MLHSCFLRKKSLILEDGSDKVFVNPILEHEDSQRLLAEVGNEAVVVTNPVDMKDALWIKPGQTISLSGFLFFRPSEEVMIIKHGETTIIYDIAISSENIVDQIKDNESINLYIPHLDQENDDMHLSIIEKLGGAKYVVPFPTIDQTQAVAFARMVMIKHLGTPKFLKAGQELVHI